MLPVAFAPSTWTATLRRIARTAVAGLVLIVGLQGIAAAPAHATVTEQSVAVTVASAAAPSVIASPVPAEVGLTTVAAGGTTADGAPRSTSGPAADAAGTESTAAGRVPGVEAVAVADPARAAIARRGPPRA
ncbi:MULTISPECIES: hypothetical protein [Micromonospora]|uniref:hypothetical protein n=1 Tax=Micromonospora TaxID=1873 RepID=UPI0003EED411|nr:MULTISPECIES: hypothetical protein [Micromonospora]EWM66278.1 hypothetical protein MCBG_03411 [Micromonospora sp. M42]MBC8988646.1 hypothetical protein [Micromonospora chalcea]MBQ1060806.1 hypothetical protein [Micromonospora sp. C41]MCK1805021.1 hypothetical protein [Micromonospora sp. R42106]MCK1830023.1 hypothetical protein [Micromonospora sp. R42003]